MDEKRAADLASRLVAGESLSPAEEQWLLRWWEKHPESRESFFADEETDSLLRGLPQFANTEDVFVTDVLRKIAAPAASAAPPRQATPEIAVGRSTQGQRIAPVKLRDRPDAAGLTPSALGGFLGAGLATLVLIGIGGLLWLAEPARTPTTPGPRTLDLGFATVSAPEGAAWNLVRDRAGRRPDRLKLKQGAAEVHYKKGTRLRVRAPAELDLPTPDEVRLHRGALSAQVPAAAIGFTVLTPVGRLVDLGTEFDVEVDSSGKTEMSVRQGKVSFEPRREGEPPGRSIELAAGQLDRAVSSAPDVAAPVLPVSTIARGSSGRFIGVISANGKAVEFESFADFERCQTRVVEQLRNSPADFARHWSSLVSATVRAEASVQVDGGHPEASAGVRSRSITIDENGRTVSISENSATGIRVTIVDVVDGEPRETRVGAADAPTLKDQHPEAYELYERYLGGP